jgi:hypothetical protein
MYTAAVISIMLLLQEAGHTFSLRKHGMTDQGMMALQNCMDLKKEAPDLCNETCLAYSQEGDGGIRIKVEVVSDVEVEDNPVSALLPGIKVECEVRFMSVCPLLRTLHACP